MTLSRRRFALGALGALGAGLTACTGRRGDTNRFGARPSAEAAGPSGASAAEWPLLEPLPSPTAPELRRDPFALGVGSGDPVPDGVVLWTRLLPEPTGGGPADDLTLVWELAVVEPGNLEGFTRLVATGTVETGPDVGHSVHVEVAGLRPDQWYRYRFRIGPWTSPLGYTRTAPAPGALPAVLRLAVASCQDWQAGFYAAYRHLVEDPPDLVVFCGDYVYEAAPTPGVLRSHDGPEPTTLEGYRARYALYRSDPDLQAAHAACPWVVTWDDHEVVNGYAGTVGRAAPVAAAVEEEQADSDAFLERRAAAYRAWWEHMAVRGAAPSGPDLTVHRSLGWGRLAQLIVLDGRQYRSELPCGDGLVEACDELAWESATMLGLDQEAWLAERLAEARAHEVTWTVLVNQTLMTEFPVPATPGGAAQIYADGWDGYPAARRRLLEASERAGVANLVVLTGDLHASVVGELRLDGRPVGTELVGPGVSSPFPAARAGLFGLAPAVLPQVTAADARHRGYVRSNVTAQSWWAEYRWVDAVDRPDAPLSQDAPAFLVEAGTPGAQRRPNAWGR